MTEPIEPSRTADWADDQANEADIQEQAQEQALGTTEGDGPGTVRTSNEVDEFDAAEQGRTVELDPEEYR